MKKYIRMRKRKMGTEKRGRRNERRLQELMKRQMEKREEIMKVREQTEGGKNIEQTRDVRKCVEKHK